MRGDWGERRSGGQKGPDQCPWRVAVAMPSEAPSRLRWSWGHRREARGEHKSQAGGSLQDQKRERRRTFDPPTQAWENCEHLGHIPHPPKPPEGCMSPGGIRGRLGRTGEARGRGPPGPEEQERSGGHLPCPLEPRKPAGLPGEVPRPLRLEAGRTTGPHLFHWA